MNSNQIPGQTEIRVVREVPIKVISAVFVPIFLAICGSGLAMWREFHTQTTLLQEVRTDLRASIEKINTEKARNDVQDVQIQNVIREQTYTSNRIDNLERARR